ncbi:MAG: hypothetical protein KBT30_02395 [Clostridiales bacterium]|nr:hypothetical protein [Candidatus Apopatousia equi]
MNKEETEKILNAIHENLQMAVQSLDIITKEVEDKEFLTYITKQNEEYNNFLKECNMIAKSYDIELKNHIFEKAQLWMSLKMNTLIDKSVRKYARLIYFGTSMGIPDLIIAIADYPQAVDEARELANRIKLAEEDYEMEIKQFIGKGKPNKDELKATQKEDCKCNCGCKDDKE